MEGRKLSTFDVAQDASLGLVSRFSWLLSVWHQKISQDRQLLLHFKAGCATGLYQHELVNVKE